MQLFFKKKISHFELFRVWNYNKGDENVFRGVKDINISINDNYCYSGILRRGPGIDGINYSQDIRFTHLRTLNSSELSSNNQPLRAYLQTVNYCRQRSKAVAYIRPQLKQCYETVSYPCGMLYHFTFFDNWDDRYYVGLDSIEMFDIEGNVIDISQSGGLISAVPHSLRDIIVDGEAAKILSSDPRIPEQLFCGGNATEASSWLAPLANCMSADEKIRSLQRYHHQSAIVGQARDDLLSNFPENNILTVCFPYPVAISMIR